MKNDIKYILKRVIVGVIIGIVLFNIKSCQVKAITNNVIGDEVEFPTSTGDYAFISMNENYRITNIGYRYFHGSTLNPDLYMGAPTNINATCGTYGCGIYLSNLSFIKDKYYSITIYLLGDSTPNWHYSYSALDKKVGISTSLSGMVESVFVEPLAYSGRIKSCSSLFDNEYTGNCVFSWTIIFKSPVTGSSLATWWSSSPIGADPQDNGFFVGYTLKYIGDDNITSAQLQSALNNVSDNVINNQNENTQQQIESQKVCFDYTFEFTKDNVSNLGAGYLTSNGNVVSGGGFYHTNYIPINKNTIYTLSNNYTLSQPYYCIYDNNKTLISCTSYNDLTTRDFYSTSDGYVRFSVYAPSNQSRYTRLIGQYCGNGNQQISGQITDVQDKQDITNEKLDDINNTMNDSSTDSPNTGINAVKNGLASNGVITQLITLPVTLFQQILTSINGTCQTFNLGALFGTNLTLPCINVANYLGSALWGIIDVIISGYFVWVIARKMISAFEMFSAMKDGDVLDD